MNEQTLMLGNVNLREYFLKKNISTRSLETVKSELKHLKDYKNNLDKLEKNSYTCEQEIYRNLNQEWQEANDKTLTEFLSLKYPLIDLSFLSKRKIKFLKDIEVEVDVPAFCPYSLYDLKNTLTSTIELHKNEFYTRNIANSKINSELKKVFNFPYDFLKLYFSKKVEFSSTFRGLIPPKIKKEIEKAKKYFFEGDLYLIAEVEPSAWNAKVSPIVKDPIIIGMWHEKEAHLIAHFNTTPLEDLAVTQFLKSKFN